MDSRNFLLLPVVLAVAWSCRDVDGVVCAQNVEEAIRVEVRDSLTNAPVAHRALGWIRDGHYVDSLRITWWTGTGPDSLRAVGMSAGPERPGTYDVFLRRSGYLDWQVLGVGVSAGLCGVEPVKLLARLMPVS